MNDKVDTNDAPSLANLQIHLEKDTELTDTKVESVHLVTRGANQKKLHLVKSAGKRTSGSNFMDQEQEAAFAIDVLKQDTPDGEVIEKEFKGLPPEATEALTGIMKLTKSVAEVLPDDVFERVAALSGFKKGKGKPSDGDGDDGDDGEDGDDDEEEDGDGAKKSKARKMKKSIEKALEKIEKEEDLDLLPEDVQKAVRPLWREKFALEERIRKMEEADRERVFVQKAAQYTRIAKGADFVALMKEAADNLSEKGFQSFIHLLDAHEEMLRKGDLFAEYGSALETDASDPLTRWDALAQERVQKSGVTYEQAYTDIVHADPEGYNQVLQRNLTAGRQ